MLIRKPSFYDSFRCVASRCPDSCCQLWDVAVDPEKAAYYRGLTGALGDRLRSFLTDEEGETYLGLDGTRCPMWRADGLCRIQAELGEGALCKTCREFPRLTHEYEGFTEYGLELSCPEAARIMLSEEDWAWTEEGQAEPVDSDMVLLLRTRKKAMALTKEEKPLQKLFLYGLYVQDLLDGEEKTDFSADAIPTVEEKGNREAFLSVFRDLEILTPRWAALLEHPQPRAMGREDRAMLRYLISRYWLQSISDLDLMCRVKFMIASVVLVCLLGGDCLQTAQRWSKEIENDADNVDALLDGAYTLPGLTDRNLLALMKEMEV